MRQVACAILVRDGLLLLGKRSPHRRSYPNLWDVLGGHLEPGETFEAALVREVREEVGLTPTSFRLVATIDEPCPDRYGPAELHFFAVDAWEGDEPRLLGEEHTALHWFDPEAASRLPDLAWPGYSGIFAAIDGKAPGRSDTGSPLVP